MEEYASIQAQLKKRTLLLGIPCGLLLAGIIATLVMSIGSKTIHLEWLTTTLSIVLGALILFMDAMTIAPVRAYKRHLNNVLNGRTHTMEGYFKSYEEEVCLREGVNYHAMIVADGDMEDEEAERLFYYDAMKPFPALEPGDRVRVTYHDKSVAGLEKMERARS